MKRENMKVWIFVSAVALLGAVVSMPSIEAQRGPRRGGAVAGIGAGPRIESNQNVQQVSAHPGRGFRGGAAQGEAFQGQVAQGGPGRGNRGGGRGRQGGPGDAAHAVDMKAIQFLLANRSKIQRTVKNLPDGVETVTESDDPEVTKVLVEHVNAMYKRVEENRPIHARDPLFAELFRNASTLVMKVEKTEKGVKVIETSKNPFSAKLIQAHAKVVSLFLKNGHTEVRKNHAVPE